MKVLQLLHENSGKDLSLDLETFKGKQIPNTFWHGNKQLNLHALHSDPSSLVQIDTKPAGLLYHGMNVFDVIHKDAANRLTLSSAKLTRGIYEISDVYLGYIPSEDVFVIGYDGWYEDDDGDTVTCSPFVFFAIGKDSKIVVRRASYTFDGATDLWYDGPDGGYRLLQLMYPDVIDIRLD